MTVPEPIAALQPMQPAVDVDIIRQSMSVHLDEARTAAMKASRSLTHLAVIARALEAYASVMTVRPAALPASTGTDSTEMHLLTQAERFMRVAAADRSDFRPHQALGFLHGRRGETDAAVACLRRSLAWFGRNGVPFLHLAMFHQAQGCHDEALRHALAALNASQWFNTARFMVAGLLRTEWPGLAAMHYAEMLRYRPIPLYYGASFAKARVERAEKRACSADLWSSASDPAAPLTADEEAFLQEALNTAWRQREEIAPWRERIIQPCIDNYRDFAVFFWNETFHAIALKNSHRIGALQLTETVTAELPDDVRAMLLSDTSQERLIAAIDQKREAAIAQLPRDDADAAGQRPVYFVTAVWGTWHTGIFLEVNLPSLLADGNLPALCRLRPVVYWINTTRADAERMRQAPVMRALSKLVTIHLQVLDDALFGDPVATHVHIWTMAVDRARQDFAYLVPNPADMLWADGSFGYIGRCIDAGKRAIYAGVVRVTHETFTAAHASPNGQPIAIPPRRLVAETMRHIHPMMAAYFRDSEQVPFHFEYLYWPVPGEGFVIRLFATTVYCLDTCAYEIDNIFSIADLGNPDELLCIDDSDDFFGVSITPLAKDTDWYALPQTVQANAVGEWWLSFDGPVQVPLVMQPVRVHAGPLDNPLWRRRELESQFLVVQALIAREAIRFGRFMRMVGLTSAAEIVATALYGNRLRRAWRWHGPVTVFCPVEPCFAVLPEARRQALLTVEGRSDLADAIAAHVCYGSLELPAGGGSATDMGLDVMTIGGQLLHVAFNSQEWLAGECRVLRGHILPQGQRLYEIDGFLDGTGIVA